MTHFLLVVMQWREMVGGGENSWKEMTVFLTYIFRLHYYYVTGEMVSLRTIGDMNVSCKI